MKLNAELEGSTHALTFALEGEKIRAQVDGREYELELRVHVNGYLILDGTRVYDCHVERSQNLFTVQLEQRSYAITIVDPKRLRGTGAAGGQDHGSAKILAPMPGKVVRVLVAEGAEVEPGTGILVVEAMKMQNELKSPKPGKVVTINVEPGATVNAGDVLAVIE
jgi:biotin carboxyl carrier protein